MHAYKAIIANCLCDSCNMDMSDLPNMYAQSPRDAGPIAEGIHIRQITSAHVTTNIRNTFLPSCAQAKSLVELQQLNL